MIFIFFTNIIQAWLTLIFSICLQWDFLICTTIPYIFIIIILYSVYIVSNLSLRSINKKTLYSICYFYPIWNAFEGHIQFNIFFKDIFPALFTEKLKLHNLIGMPKSPMRMLLVNIMWLAYRESQINAKLLKVVENSVCSKEGV